MAILDRMFDRLERNMADSQEWLDWVFASICLVGVIAIVAMLS